MEESLVNGLSGFVLAPTENVSYHWHGQMYPRMSAQSTPSKQSQKQPCHMNQKGRRKQTNILMSNVQNPVDIPLYWLVNRDPYNGLL